MNDYLHQHSIELTFIPLQVIYLQILAFISLYLPAPITTNYDSY